MPNLVQWGAAASGAGTILSTAEISTLTAGARTNGGTIYANQTGLNQYGWLEAIYTHSSAPTDGGAVNFYMLKSPDASNYEDGSSSVRPGGMSWCAAVDSRAVNTVQRRVSNMFVIPPMAVKFIMANDASQTISGGTVVLWIANDEIQ